MRAEAIDQALVEIEAFLVHRPAAILQNPRPGQTEAIVLRPELSHQLYVRFVAMVVVAGDLPAARIVDPPRHLTESVPNARLAAAFRRRTFHLKRSGGRAPGKIRRESACGQNRISAGLHPGNSGQRGRPLPEQSGGSQRSLQKITSALRFRSHSP